MPNLPWPMYGIIPGSGANVFVTQKNLSTGEEETIYSTSDGSFLLDPNNFPRGYNEELGDVLRIGITAGNFYADVILDRVSFPDGREVVFNQAIEIIEQKDSVKISRKFSKIHDTFVILPGGVSTRRSGLG